jgi:hypothetical protein
MQCAGVRRDLQRALCAMSKMQCVASSRKTYPCQKCHRNVTASPSDWMERHIFPADYNRCQERRQAQIWAGTGRLLQIVASYLS